MSERYEQTPYSWMVDNDEALDAARREIEELKAIAEQATRRGMEAVTERDEALARIAQLEKGIIAHRDASRAWLHVAEKTKARNKELEAEKKRMAETIEWADNRLSELEAALREVVTGYEDASPEGQEFDWPTWHENARNILNQEGPE